jgi:hypothetical protein
VPKIRTAERFQTRIISAQVVSAVNVQVIDLIEINVTDPSDYTPPDTPSLISELVQARRACTRQERVWLRKMAESDLNAYAVGKELGYSTNTIWKFLRRERVQKVLGLQNRQIEQDLGISRAWLLMRHKRLADSDMSRFLNASGTPKLPSEWGPDDSPTVQEYSFDGNGNPKLKLHDKSKSLETLTKYARLVAPDRLELTGKDGAPIAYTNADELSDEQLAAIARRGRPASPESEEGED